MLTEKQVSKHRPRESHQHRLRFQGPRETVNPTRKNASWARNRTFDDPDRPSGRKKKNVARRPVGKRRFAGFFGKRALTAQLESMKSRKKDRKGILGRRSPKKKKADRAAETACTTGKEVSLRERKRMAQEKPRSAGAVERRPEESRVMRTHPGARAKKRRQKRALTKAALEAGHRSTPVRLPPAREGGELDVKERGGLWSPGSSAQEGIDAQRGLNRPTRGVEEQGGESLYWEGT